MTKKELTEKFASIRGISHITREFTPEEMTVAYVNGYNEAMNIACEYFKGTIMYRMSLYGKNETRVFDDGFIKYFREMYEIKE